MKKKRNYKILIIIILAIIFGIMVYFYMKEDKNESVQISNSATRK